MTRRVLPLADSTAPPAPAFNVDGERSLEETLTHQDSGAPGASTSQAWPGRSFSLPWRRPKNLPTGFEDVHELPHQLSELNENAIDDSYDLVSLHQPYYESASGSASLMGMFRRASVSLKGRLHRQGSLSGDHHTLQSDRSPQRPTTSHHTWSRLRQAASLRTSRSSYGLNATHVNITQEPLSLSPPPADYSDLSLPVPGTAADPPVIPPHSGAAAKASAAMQNEFLARQGLQNRSPPQSWGEEGNDRESGIGIAAAIPGLGTDVDGDDDAAGAGKISQIDFISQLPSELAIHILANLDAAALAKASLVSREWKHIVDNQHIWREACLRETGATYATSGPVRPDAGLGLPAVHPSSDWRDIYRVKVELARRWKAGKTRPIYLNGHLDSIYCLQFDERKIITGSRDKTIRVWDMHTYECRLIIGPPDVVNSHEMHRDENSNLVHYTSNADGSRLCESTPRTKSFDTHHNASILCLQYDDGMLVTGSSDSTCIVYDIKDGYRPVARLQHHAAAVLDLAFDDKHIVTCSKDISICVWDRRTLTLLRQLRGHTGPVNAVQMRGNTIVSCSGDFRVKLWNIDTGKNIREFTGHNKGLACCQFSEDGRYVASAGNDKVIRIWDANTGECVREMRAHDGLVRSLHIDSVSGRLVSGSYDTDIKVWDMETGHQLLDFPRWHQSWVLSAKSDYRRIVSTGQDPKILIMDFGADVDGIGLLESKPPAQGLDGDVPFI